MSRGTETSLNQHSNGHRVVVRIHAVSNDGVSFPEKELRSMEDFFETYLVQRGFSGYVDVDIARVSLLERFGVRLFGK